MEASDSVLERIALRLHRLELLCVAPDLREEFASDRIKPHVHLLGSDCVFRLQLLQICLHHLKCAHEFFRPSDQLGLKHFKALRDLFEPLLGHGVLAQELWMLECLLNGCSGWSRSGSRIGPSLHSPGTGATPPRQPRLISRLQCWNCAGASESRRNQLPFLWASNIWDLRCNWASGEQCRSWVGGSSC